MAEVIGAPGDELVPLNIDDLDVAELERRLELAAALPNADCWVQCSANGIIA